VATNFIFTKISQEIDTHFVHQQDGC